MSTERVAYQIIVFGRGLKERAGEYQLSDPAKQRVEAVIEYVVKRVDTDPNFKATIICSGGWPGAAAGTQAPPLEYREGRLMRDYADDLLRKMGLESHATILCEDESDSTLENCLKIAEAGMINLRAISTMEPLGLVGHKGHLRRIAFLVRKVFGMPRSKLLNVVAPGHDQLSSDIPELVMYVLTQIAFFGTRSPEHMRRREAMLIWLVRRLR